MWSIGGMIIPYVTAGCRSIGKLLRFDFTSDNIISVLSVVCVGNVDISRLPGMDCFVCKSAEVSPTFSSSKYACDARPNFFVRGL